MGQIQEIKENNFPDWVDDSQDAIYKGFTEYFKALEDNRVVYLTSHKLLEVIFIGVCAYICGANSWDGVFEFAKVRENWLKRYLALENGLPSRVTYWRIFSQLEPQTFQNCFKDWAESLLGQSRHIAIDGKKLRGVYHPTDPNISLILVSAWATERGLLLGQVKTDEKSNEITAIPKLLNMIHVKDCIVTLDAMGCQTEIAKRIVNGEGEYLLALKGNQGTLKDDVELFFKGAIDTDWEDVNYERYETLEKGHGRIDTRTAYLVKDIEWLNNKKDWPNLQGIIMMISQRQSKGKKSTETRYYITSSGMKVEGIALAIRMHWGIENGLHWSLDVGFREDRQVARKANLAENLAVIRRIAFNYLNQENSNLSIENKRLKSAMDPNYLEQVLKIAKPSNLV